MRIALGIDAWSTRARRLGALTIGLAALAAPQASAAPSLLDDDASDAFYCSLHKDSRNAASRAASVRAASGEPQARAAFARPPQPNWVTGQEFRDPPVLRSRNGVLNVTLSVAAQQGAAGRADRDGHHVQRQLRRPDDARQARRHDQRDARQHRRHTRRSADQPALPRVARVTERAARQHLRARRARPQPQIHRDVG